MRQKRPVSEEQFALLSVKYGVYLSELFEAHVLAKNTGEALCLSLKIRYRGTIGGQAIFLITKEGKVVAQFQVAEEFLLRKNIPFESWLDTDKIRRQINRQNRFAEGSTLIGDLRHGMKKVNLKAQVVGANKSLLVHTRYGNSATVSNAWVADKTGKVMLCLWNEQIKQVSVGRIIQIKNASVSTYRGERQLRLGKTGTISELQSLALEPLH